VAIAATAARTGLYLYCITAANRGLVFPARGVDGAVVEPLAECGLTAVVSRVPAGKVRPQRASLAAHHRILSELAERQPVLPVVFGTVAADEDELRDILRRNRHALADLLQRLRGKVEMGLKVYWDTPNIFDYFVATHQELEAMRNRLFRPGRTPSVAEKLALGELFAALLQQARQRHTRRVKESLAPCCVEIRSVDPGSERMIMKLACLVEKDRQQHWEDGVHRAAALFDDNYRFDYSGPWLPYNFVDVDLQVT
jgi:hypothetical protein